MNKDMHTVKSLQLQNGISTETTVLPITDYVMIVMNTRCILFSCICMHDTACDKAVLNILGRWLLCPIDWEPVIASPVYPNKR